MESFHLSGQINYGLIYVDREALNARHVLIRTLTFKSVGDVPQERRAANQTQHTHTDRFQIAYFLLLVHTAAALSKHALLHAVCLQLGHTMP